MHVEELEEALGAGGLAAVRALVDAGADLHYRNEAGYDALIDAVHGRDVARDPHLLELLAYLVAQRVNLSGASKHGESGLRVLSRLGRFDAVKLLLDAGADRSHLGWTPLMEAVAMGSLAEVEAALESSPDLEARDWWSRTAWLIAIAAGDISKVKLLQDRGADVTACGRCGSPPIFHAIRGHHVEMLRWLLAEGADVHQVDEFGGTALIEAVEGDDLECVEILLQTGADVSVDHNGTAVTRAESRAMILRLLEAGADPADVPYAAQRILIGLGPIDSSFLDVVAEEEFERNSARRFGGMNPERMTVPFWEAMIRSGANAYAARDRFDRTGSDYWRGPVWCAERFGQSWTLLPDGRVVQIGGEHEDSYDPDFCIYNDVIVFDANGDVTIYGYPEAVFPPTDFHTATLVGESIYIIGCLGYAKVREDRRTPVYRLDLATMRIEELETSGNAAGWIYKHRASTVSAQEIRIWGGTKAASVPGGERHEPNTSVFVLDLSRLEWRAE